MNCTRNVTDDIVWVGANDRRLSLFEGVYSVPEGVSYNSYLLLDEKTVLFDTVDNAVRDRFMENVVFTLNGRALDYLILQHLEPDHAAGILDIVRKYPSVTLVLNARSKALAEQFFEFEETPNILLINEYDTLTTGSHTLHFILAPMVHWPEVMLTYDDKTKILFSADAFGGFGSLHGALFADEIDFKVDYLQKMRRYYTNIVGKYGVQVRSLLTKMARFDIEVICPLHGFVWRKNLRMVMDPHIKWGNYDPEEQGVMLAYASVYGNTANATDILACELRELGIKTMVYDVSVTPASEIVAEAFRWSHLVFASTTYNAGIFVNMEALIYDLMEHNIQKRPFALIENGSWALSSGKLMKERLSKGKDMEFIGSVSLKSAVKTNQVQELKDLALAISKTFPS
ncbi:MAG: FprA family A-type flavoprotein [Turicibacter sp.]|nr:FprA family A-type flavoprotein [Turicibacter sp.]